MNILEAIKEAKNDSSKVYVAGGYEIQAASGSMYDVRLNGCGYVAVENMPDLMQLDFTEVKPATDWSKVKVDAKVKCTQQHGETVNRHFAYFEDGEVHTWMFGVTSWSGNGPSETSPWNPEQVELVED